MPTGRFSTPCVLHDHQLQLKIFSCEQGVIEPKWHRSKEDVIQKRRFKIVMVETVENKCPLTTEEAPARKPRELIIFNEKRVPQNIGICKLLIDLRPKYLYVKPQDQRFNDIAATFDWKFIRSKNILFVFADWNLQDFVLVFKNEEICIKVFNGIFKNREVDYVNEDLLKERFLNSLFKNASKNWRMKEILEEWIQKFDEKEKNEYLKLLQWHKENPEYDDDEIDIKDVKKEIDPLPTKNRKRRHHEIDNNLSDSVNIVDQGIVDGRNSCHVDESLEHPTTQMKNLSANLVAKIDDSNFLIVNQKTANGFRRKLLIFTSSDRKNCYEFLFHRKKQFFYHRCREGLKGIKAHLALDENGNECIKMDDKQHQCPSILYEPEKYLKLKIAKKPDYEILDNCANPSKSRKMLIIFDPNDRSKCYEYFWQSNQKTFYCRGCNSSGNKWLTADIFHENSESEYILLSDEGHVCEMRKYNSAKYFPSNQIILSPNFEIQTKIRDEIERKTLIAFYDNDRKLCYVYYSCTKKNRFFCKGCWLKNKKYVYAKIFKNNENEEYAVLSKEKHVCSPLNYVPQNEIIILRPPKFRFFEASEMFKSKLFIFDTTDSQLCYTFSQDGEKRRYHCLGCMVVSQKKNKMNEIKCHQGKQVVTVYLEKDDGPNGEYFVKMNSNEKHICEPRKFDAKTYEIKILKPSIDYILFRAKFRNVEHIYLVIYHPDDKKLCYKYCYNKFYNAFRCSACGYKNITITAKLHQDLDGNEYLTTSEKKHVCTLLEYSSVITADTEILEKSGFDFGQLKKKEINEDRIIRLPKFELHQNSKGVPERRLIIFVEDDQKLCYDYKYQKSKDYFTCKICNSSAKIRNDEKNGNVKYVILSEIQHKCEPVNYEPEKEIAKKEKKKKIEPSKTLKDKFIFHFNDSGNFASRLTVLNDVDKSIGYQYFFHQNLYYCFGCRTEKKYSSAKLITDKDGNQSIKFGKFKHVCTIRNLKDEKLYFDNFKYEQDGNILITMDPTQKNQCFKFEYDEKLGTFCCSKCLEKKKKYITATICKENDGKEFVLLNVPHCCSSVLE